MTQKQKKLFDEYKNKLKKLVKDDYGDANDVEKSHELADDLLCDFLKELGFGELVDVYNEVSKYYA